LGVTDSLAHVMYKTCTRLGVTDSMAHVMYKTCTRLGVTDSMAQNLENFTQTTKVLL
jgi:hypothetical protein